MIRKYMLFLMIVALILVSGCVPLYVWDYYSPTAEHGIAKRSGKCSGPPDAIEFIHNNVKIHVVAIEEEKGMHVRIQLDIPKGKKVHLANATIQVSTPSKSTAMDVLLKPYIYGNAQNARELTMKINETLLGDTWHEKNLGFTLTYNNVFYINADIVMPKSDVIKIKLPEFYINDQKIQLPAISFKKDSYLELFVPLNC